MSIPRGMDMMGPGRRFAGMPGAPTPPRSTMGDEQPFSEDDLGSVLAAMMGVPMPQGGGGAGMNAGMMQALRARMQGPEAKTAGAPAARPIPMTPMAPMSRVMVRPRAVKPEDTRLDIMKRNLLHGSEYMSNTEIMPRSGPPPPMRPATGAMDDLPPLAPMHPDAMSSLGPKKMGWKYDGPDAADLARRYDDEWWANHAANPPPPMRPGPEEPLPPLPPPDPEFIRALQRSMQKTGR